MLRCAISQCGHDVQVLLVAAEVVGAIEMDASTCTGMIVSGTIEALLLSTRAGAGRVQCDPELHEQRGATGKRPAVSMHEDVGGWHVRRSQADNHPMDVRRGRCHRPGKEKANNEITGHTINNDWTSLRIGAKVPFWCTSVNFGLGSSGSDSVAQQHFAIAHKPPKRCETPLRSHVPIRSPGSNLWSMSTSQRGNTPGQYGNGGFTGHDGYGTSRNENELSPQGSSRKTGVYPCQIKSEKPESAVRSSIRQGPE
jgi:hypothetical protein